MHLGELESVLAEAIGPEHAHAAAEAVASAWGDTHQYIPPWSSPDERIAQRNRKIRSLYRSGVSVPALIDRFGCSESTIRRAIRSN